MTKFIDNYLQKNNHRVLGLDIVRSIAILLVVYRHSSALVSEALRQYYLVFIPFIDGVGIFFVLSGFLIGGILLRTIKNADFTILDLLKFWIRRWFKTLPNYYLLLLILNLLLIRTSRSFSSIDYTYFFFSQNLFTQHPQFFSEAWSLSIEEWFYLLFPLLFFLIFRLTKKKKKSFLIAAFFFLIVPVVIRYIKHAKGIEISNWGLAYRKIVILRLDSLMYGVLGAYLYHYKNQLWLKFKNFSLFIGLIIVLEVIAKPPDHAKFCNGG